MFAGPGNLPLISVIVPNLNEEKVLPYFLDSLRGQEYRGFELVVVDGGSCDASEEIVAQFDPFFSIVKLVDETRNLGFIRNLGAKHSARECDLLLFTNSDAVLPSDLLMNIAATFNYESRLQALSGRTIPFNGGALCFAAYTCFDMIRSFMANRLGRFSPSGNFLAIRKELFWRVGGFPQARINEDGLLGQRISSFCRAQGLSARFDLRFKTGHFAKRFRSGPLKTLLFYSYVFGNFSPGVARLLSAVERKSGEAFIKR